MRGFHGLALGILGLSLGASVAGCGGPSAYDVAAYYQEFPEEIDQLASLTVERVKNLGADCTVAMLYDGALEISESSKLREDRARLKFQQYTERYCALRKDLSHDDAVRDLMRTRLR